MNKLSPEEYRLEIVGWEERQNVNLRKYIENLHHSWVPPTLAIEIIQPRGGNLIEDLNSIRKNGVPGIVLSGWDNHKQVPVGYRYVCKDGSLADGITIYDKREEHQLHVLKIEFKSMEIEVIQEEPVSFRPRLLR